MPYRSLYHQRGNNTMSAAVDALIINDQYLVMVAISILFTIITIYRRTVLLDLLTTVCWWITAAVHLLASPTSTPLYSMSIFYWGIGLIFFVLVWADVIQIWNINKSNKGYGAL